VLGCVPKLAFIAASIPSYVLGGVAIVMFGLVAATGIRIFSHVDFVRNRKNSYVVAVSLALGMIPLVANRFFSQLPPVVDKFMHNGILLGTLTAVLVNFALNRGDTAEAAPSVTAATDSGAATGCR
jgi:NCS2 family nucleobase:cation symporter-2